jgi:hypothetical protein
MSLVLQTSNTCALIARTQWAAICAGAFAGLTCLGTALLFLYLASERPGAPLLFIVPFSTVFALAGTAITVQLVRYARGWLRDGGVRVAMADAEGLTIADSIGTARLTVAWPQAAEIVLADQLKLVEYDETAYCRAKLIVFLRPETMNKSLFARLNAGISRSGTGRPYASTDYPRSQAAAVRAALRQFAPRSVPVSIRPSVTFDRKAGTDKLT